jgi:hypothetical protein
MNTTAVGLLSMVRILGSIPIIRLLVLSTNSSESVTVMCCRAPPGAAAEMLAHEFNGLLKESISSRGPAQALFEVLGLCKIYL